MCRLQKIFIITVSWCVIAACSAPIGTIERDAAIDDFWLVPRRQVYYVGDYFNKNNDLWLFFSDRGIVQQIPVRDAALKLISNPNAAEPREYPITEDTLRLLNDIGIGRKIIEASYGNKTAEYSIEIMDPYNLTPDDPPAGDGETGFEVMWKK